MRASFSARQTSVPNDKHVNQDLGAPHLLMMTFRGLVPVTRPSGELMYISYARHYRPARPRHLSNFSGRFSKTFVQLLAHLAHIDIYGTVRRDQEDAAKRHIATVEPQLGRPSSRRKGGPCRLPRLLRPIEHSDWYRVQNLGWLSDLIFYCYLATTLHLLVYLYHQYRFDFDKMRLARLRELFEQTHISHKQFEQLAFQLLGRLEDSRVSLRLIGSPHRHLGIAVECWCVFMVLSSFVMYFVCFMYYRLVAPFQLQFVRELIDLESEQRRLKAQMEREVMRYIDSSFTFSKIPLEHGQHGGTISSCQLPIPCGRGQMRDAKSWPRSAGSHNLDAVGDSPYESTAPKAYQLCEILTRMLNSGALKPYNSSLGWLEIRLRIALTYHVCISFYFLLFCYYMFFVSLKKRESAVPLTWNDLALMCSIAILVLITFVSVNFFSTSFFIGALDQIFLINKLHKLIGDCIRENSLEFALLLKSQLVGPLPPPGRRGAQKQRIQAETAPTRRREGPAGGKRLPLGPVNHQQPAGLRLHEQKMNSNYLFVLMHYKIFVNQYKPTLRTLEPELVIITVLVLLIPIIIKLHIPYLNMFQFQNVKWLGIALSTSVLVPANLALVPICHMHARYVNLYRMLSSLIAHIIEIESHEEACGSIYDAHAVSILLRELRHTDRFLDTHSIGMSATYTSLVKAHFWWGILVLSILVDEQNFANDNDAYKTIMSDPLGVFRRTNYLHHK